MFLQIKSHVNKSQLYKANGITSKFTITELFSSRRKWSNDSRIAAERTYALHNDWRQAAGNRAVDPAADSRDAQ